MRIKMKTALTVAVTCHKGGVGKTTTAASLAGLLSARGERVLLVDMDPQTNLTRTFTDGNFPRTVYDALRNRRDIPVFNVRDNLDIVPGSVDTCSADMELAASINREYILSRLIEPLRADYRWILVDCPAQLGISTVNALVAADYALVPMSCDAYSGDGLSQIMSFIDRAREANDRLEICGVVVTRYRARRTVDNAVCSILDREWSDLVFRTRIRENAAIVQAPMLRTDVSNYDPKSNGAKDYASLLDELCEKVRR